MYAICFPHVAYIYIFHKGWFKLFTVTLPKHELHVSLLLAQLQTPASFAQSVQELTIALQRTGDPANLNRLRPHLELLANIDPSPGMKLAKLGKLDAVSPVIMQIMTLVFFQPFAPSSFQYILSKRLT